MAVLKYIKAQQNILNYIAKNNFTIGDRLPSERDFAHHIGISVITLRRALLEFENSGIIERRHGSGTYLNKSFDTIPNQGTIGYLVIPSKKNNIKSPEIFELTEVLKNRGYLLKYITAFNVPDNEILNELSKTKGIIISGVIKKEIVDVLITLGLPIVAVGSIPPDCMIPSIDYDWKLSSKLLAEYFFSKNIRNISLINSALYYRPSYEIYKGFKEAFNEASMSFNEEDILWTEPGRRYESILAFLKKAPYDAFIIEQGNLQDFLFCMLENGWKSEPHMAILSVEPKTEKKPSKVIETSFRENIIVRAVEVLFESIDEKKFKKEKFLLTPTLVEYS